MFPELRFVIEVLIVVLVIVVVLLVIGAAMSVRVVKQYEQGVLFRLGRVLGARTPGLRIIVPFVDVLHRVSLRIVTMPIQSQGIITQDNVSVDVSAVAYFRVVDAVKSVVAIEDVQSAIDQIAQTTLRKVVGQRRDSRQRSPRQPADDRARLAPGSGNGSDPNHRRLRRSGCQARKTQSVPG
jgi:regulator of protease activity HflC (stomatin/prohibitin superfamily)